MNSTRNRYYKRNKVTKTWLSIEGCTYNDSVAEQIFECVSETSHVVGVDLDGSPTLQNWKHITT